jgi:hypothetical protein
VIATVEIVGHRREKVAQLEGTRAGIMAAIQNLTALINARLQHPIPVEIKEEI